MSDRTLRIYILLGLATIIVIFFSMFKITKVPDVNWTANYSPESKEPYGTFIFKTLLEEKYGNKAVLRHKVDTSLTDIKGDSSLYILISSFARLDSSELIDIQTFLKGGNEVLLIGDSDLDILEDSLPLPISRVSQDSIFKVFGPLVKRDTFRFVTYFLSFDSLYTVDYNYYHISILDSQDYYRFQPLLYFSDTALTYVKCTGDSSHFYHHTGIEFFSNLIAQQDGFAQHFDAVLSPFDVKQIIIDHPAYHPGTTYNSSESPLQFILKEPGLKWAYYLIILSFLLFLFFTAKRKQRIIPMRAMVQNSSLEYVKTLSELYEVQADYGSLIDKMASNFSHWVKHHHYMSVTDKNFVERLAHRIDRPKKEIEYIYNTFYTSKVKYKFNEFQLINLHNKLENIYNDRR